MEERLQKILSAAGAASRRKAEEYITQGRVRVNGRVASLGDRADPQRDEITLDAQRVTLPQEHVYLMLHKPVGYVTTLSDEKGRRTVSDLVRDCGVRVWPVGRLDLNSEGLLLMTDDGALTHKLIHPSHQVEKEYIVYTRGDGEKALPVLRSPMTLDGQRLHPAKVEVKSGQGEEWTFSVTIHEGKNRQVRRMCAAAGLAVVRLQRIREGKLTLGRLPVGKWRYLTAEEVRVLQEL